MEEPIARGHGNARHRERASRNAAFGYDTVRRGRVRVHAVNDIVAAAIDIEVEPVQVHRMYGDAGVDDAKVDGVAERIGEALAVRPGFAVDREPEHDVGEHQTARKGAAPPQPNHDDPTACACRGAAPTHHA